MLANTIDTVMGSASFDARIGIGNKGTLKKLVGISDIKMMHDAVTKHRSKHLALLWICNNKALRWKCLVSAIQQVITEFIQVLSQIALKFHHIRHLMLVAGSVLKCHIQIIEKLRTGEVVGIGTKR